MKRIYFIAALLLAFTASYAQPKAPTGITGGGWTWSGPMLNLSNTYANPTKDTVRNGVTRYFNIASKTSTGVPSALAAVPYPITTVHYDLYAWKVSSVNATAAVQLQRSIDGTNWVDVPSVSLYSVVPTSTTTATTKGLTLTYNPGMYHRLKVISVDDTVAITARFQADFTK